MKGSICFALVGAMALFVPVAGYELGEADAYIGAPHAVALEPGINHIEVVVRALAICEPGYAAPPPVELYVSQAAAGPDDGGGPAWEFAKTQWSLDWLPNGTDYGLDVALNITIEAAGYDGGVAGEYRMNIDAVVDDSCSSTGYRLPARDGHGHIQVGERTAKDAPGPALPLLGLALLALAQFRRHP